MKKPRRDKPVVCVWSGQHFVPLPRFQRACDDQFDVNSEYPLVVHRERNMNQHRAYFAQLNDAFKNLDHEFDGVFPSEDHLREWALCQTEFCTVTHEAYSTKKDAMTAARALRKLAPYAVMSVVDNVLVTKHALSQSVRAMGREDFEASCRQVLEIVSGMARTTPRELRKNAGRAA